MHSQLLSIRPFHSTRAFPRRDRKVHWKQQRGTVSIPVSQIKPNKIWHIDITNFPAEIMHHQAIEYQRPEHEAAAATAANAHQRTEIAWFAIFGGPEKEDGSKKGFSALWLRQCCHDYARQFKCLLSQLSVPPCPESHLSHPFLKLWDFPLG